MTYSADYRRKEALALFDKLLTELGDDAIDEKSFDPTQPTFLSIVPTSWDELRMSGLVVENEFEGRTVYRLTADGWFESIARRRLVSTEWYESRLRSLAATARKLVGSRRDDVIIPLEQFAAEANVPMGWLFNAIDSRLYDRVWQKQGPEWSARRMVRLRKNVCVSAVDLGEDLHFEILRLQAEVADREQRLEGLECSHCLAPLSSMNTYEMTEYGDEGSVTTYVCGRVDSDDGRDVPCPSDPRFPKLEEFELQVTQNKRDPHFPWACIAKPLTPNARRLHLSIELGRTADEAKGRLKEHYLRKAKRWPK